MNRYEERGFLNRIPKKEAEETYAGGTVSRLGLVLKVKEGGEKKRRIVIDLRRSGGNAKSKLPERLGLPRVTDAVKLVKEVKKRGTTDPVGDNEMFTVLPVAREELKHALAPFTTEGEVLVFRALLFGYKVAPLLYTLQSLRGIDCQDAASGHQAEQRRASDLPG